MKISGLNICYQQFKKNNLARRAPLWNPKTHILLSLRRKGWVRRRCCSTPLWASSACLAGRLARRPAGLRLLGLKLPALQELLPQIVPPVLARPLGPVLRQLLSQGWAGKPDLSW